MSSKKTSHSGHAFRVLMLMSLEVKSLSNSYRTSVYKGEQFRAFPYEDSRADPPCRIGKSNSLSII